MKFTTANFKNANYSECHEIFVGAHTGSFKRLNVDAENPHAQVNLQDIKSLTKDSKITALNWSSDAKNEILVGRLNKFVKVYDVNSNEYLSCIELKESPIVGLCRNAGRIVAGFGSGNVHILGEREPTVLSAGDSMSRMRQCPFNEKLIATGGKERKNNLKVFDLESAKQVFSSKNLPNDFLNLEVPIWDSDMAFLDANRLSTCSRYGYIRYYDIRTQRRPIHMYSNGDQMSFSCLIAKDPYVYSGSTMGALKAFDTRNLKHFVHTYKGFTGSVSDLALDGSGKFLVSGCLDRYVRVHQTESCAMLYQCYVKSKAVRVLVRNTKDDEEQRDSEDECTMVGEENDQENQQDKEYEALFENMPVIRDTEDIDVIAPKKAKRKTKAIVAVEKKVQKLSNKH